MNGERLASVSQIREAVQTKLDLEAKLSEITSFIINGVTINQELKGFVRVDWQRLEIYLDLRERPLRRRDER